MTFSQHAAAHRHTILYYVLLFAVTLPLLLLFFIGWFVPAFGLSPWFTFCVVVSTITQFSVTIIPEVGGWKTRWHTFLSFVSALFLLPPLVFIALAESVGVVGRVVTLASLVAMVGVICAVALSKRKHNHLLFLQAGYFAAFFIAILFVAYLS